MGMDRKHWTDRDGDQLHVSRWPVLKGAVVFELRPSGERNGALVELSEAQARELVKFLTGQK
jgi:hypothetical protein